MKTCDWKKHDWNEFYWLNLREFEFTLLLLNTESGMCLINKVQIAQGSISLHVQWFSKLISQSESCLWVLQLTLSQLKTNKRHPIHLERRNEGNTRSQFVWLESPLVRATLRSIACFQCWTHTHGHMPLLELPIIPTREYYGTGLIKELFKVWLSKCSTACSAQQ